MPFARTICLVTALALMPDGLAGEAGAAPLRKAGARHAPVKRAAPADGITATYAKLCENGGTGDVETCSALKAAVLAKLQGGSVSVAVAHQAAPVLKSGFGLTIRKAKGIFVKGDVIAVDPGSPAERAGLKIGDRLLQAKGRSLLSPDYAFGGQEDLQRWFVAEAGKPQRLYYSRAGKNLSADLIIDPSWADGGAASSLAKAASPTAPVSAPQQGSLASAFGDFAPLIFDTTSGGEPKRISTVFRATQTLGDRNRSPYYVKFGWWEDKKKNQIPTEYWMDSEWGPIAYSYYSSKAGPGHFEREISGYSTKQFDVNADGSISGMGRLRNENGFNVRLIVYKREGTGMTVRLYKGKDPIPSAMSEEYLLERAAPETYEVAAAGFKTRKAQEKAAKKASGGGFLDLLGKAAQAAAIVGNDDLYRQTMIQSMNAGVPGLGSAVGAVSGGGSVPGGAGTSGGGSYPKKPNLAMGPQCPGFTMANYRTVALNGGNDQQLFSLCGQAFEYYHMYENAIAQGYGEADANRTYAAHEDSAKVANDFYRTAR